MSVSGDTTVAGAPIKNSSTGAAYVSVRPSLGTNTVYVSGSAGTSSVAMAYNAPWTAVANVREVSVFGFGAPATPGGYPSIYIAGYVNGVYGIWQSNDSANSWIQIGDYPTVIFFL